MGATGCRSILGYDGASLGQRKNLRRKPMLQLAGRMGVLGTETAFEVLARANALAAEGRSIINLGIGQPDVPTPAHIVEAGRTALADGHHRCTPDTGLPGLPPA